MRRTSIALALIAGCHLVTLTSPAAALQPARAPNVQPVPYQQSQPVPYNAGGAAAPPPATIIAPGPYTAAAPGTDVVYLKNGGMIRGTIVEILPNDHATMSLPSGQSAIIQWTAIDHIERGAVNAPTQSGSPAPPQEAPPPPITGPTVLVHIDSSHPIILDRRGPDGSWVQSCSAPCDAQMPVDTDYHLRGSGLRTSKDFRLEATAGGRVVLYVSPATSLGRDGGLIIGGVGLFGALLGLYIVLIGSVVNSASSTCFSSSGSCPQTQQDGKGAVAAGWVVTGVGAAVMVGGFILAGSNWTTTVTQQAQERDKTGSIAPEMWKRLPTWREPKSNEAPPPASVTPIWSTTF